MDGQINGGVEQLWGYIKAFPNIIIKVWNNHLTAASHAHFDGNDVR